MPGLRFCQIRKPSVLGLRADPSLIRNPSRKYSKFRGLTANAAGPLKRRFAPKKRRFAPALLGPKGSPFRPKIKKNMKNEKPSKTVREKRFSGSESRKWIRKGSPTILKSQKIGLEKKNPKKSRHTHFFENWDGRFEFLSYTRAIKEVEILNNF